MNSDELLSRVRLSNVLNLILKSLRTEYSNLPILNFICARDRAIDQRSQSNLAQNAAVVMGNEPQRDGVASRSLKSSFYRCRLNLVHVRIPPIRTDESTDISVLC